MSMEFLAMSRKVCLIQVLREFMSRWRDQITLTFCQVLPTVKLESSCEDRQAMTSLSGTTLMSSTVVPGLSF